MKTFLTQKDKKTLFLYLKGARIKVQNKKGKPLTWGEV